MSTKALVATATLCAAALPAAAREPPACRADPLDGRALYLRGTMNAWAADEALRFVWACRHWELVAALAGEHRFKIGDEGWSADADFGQRPGEALLAPRGPEIQRRFTPGTYRLRLAPAAADASGPTLSIEACPRPAPLGDTVLYLRGTMNNWAALDDFAFRWHCDAYRLNVELTGRHQFRVAGDRPGAGTRMDTPGGGNFDAAFAGAHTVTFTLDGRLPRVEVGPRTFADPRPPAVRDPVATSLAFHSRRLGHKRPFGAVPAGGEIEFEVAAARGVERIELVVERRRLEGNQELLEYTELARLPMARAEAGDGERFSARHRFVAPGVYGYWFDVLIGGRRFVLHNNADTVPWTREKGSGGRAAVAEALPARAVRRFRQTVHLPELRVPDWAADVVYYQIFPERFRNGDPSNDPQPGRERYQRHGIERHADWNELPFKPGIRGDAVHNNDFFGGDLAGIVDQLDELNDLGVNTLYLTPVNRAPSNHKYDTADYRRVDPAFGTDADFERLTREAARRGMRVIVDTSFNHVGSDSIYFDRYANHRSGGAFEGGRINPASPYAGWFRFDPAQRERDRQYRGWIDLPELPELDKSSRAVRDFAYGPGGVTQLWLDRGAAGWRMDVAPWVPDDFWREWRQAVKRHRPDALTVAEAWFESSKYLLGDMFDSTMNYVFRNTVLDYAAGGDAAALVENLELMREAYPRAALFAQMNLISSHDQPRALHALGAKGDEQDAAEIARARQRLLLAVFVQMTYPGAPTVYYGDEVGVTGGDDPYNRKTYPWPDLGGKPDLALRAQFKRLIAMRRAHAVLRRGELLAPLYVDANTWVFARRSGDTWAISASNNAGQEREVRLELPAGAPAAWRDVLEGGDVAAAGGALTLRLPPLFGRVLVSR